jgi:hypothetical protein
MDLTANRGVVGWSWPSPKPYIIVGVYVCDHHHAAAAVIYEPLLEPLLGSTFMYQAQYCISTKYHTYLGRICYVSLEFYFNIETRHKVTYTLIKQKEQK